MASDKTIGAAIVLVTAIGAVIGILVAHFSSSLAAGIAVIGIVIGTGVAWGYFSAPSPKPTTRKN